MAQNKKKRKSSGSKRAEKRTQTHEGGAGTPIPDEEVAAQDLELPEDLAPPEGAVEISTIRLATLVKCSFGVTYSIACTYAEAQDAIAAVGDHEWVALPSYRVTEDGMHVIEREISLLKSDIVGVCE